MLDLLYRWDLFLLHLFNVKLTHPYLDQFWLAITNMHKIHILKFTLFPAILATLVYIYRMEAVRILVAVAIGAGLADVITYRVVKQSVERQRPFQNEELPWVRKVGEAHGQSFPSNHAANIFATAAVLTWYIPPLGHAFYIFALLIALSRVTLGVHYPSDAIVGAMLGIFVGYLVRIFLLQKVAWFRRERHVSTPDKISSAERTRSRRE